MIYGREVKGSGVWAKGMLVGWLLLEGWEARNQTCANDQTIYRHRPAPEPAAPDQGNLLRSARGPVGGGGAVAPDFALHR